GQVALRRLWRKRQGEDEGRARTGLAFRPDVAVMALDDSGTDCKSQARAGGWSPTCPRQLHMLDPIELRKDRLQLVRWDPDPLIRDSHLQLLMLLMLLIR